jgi:uncharacterized protein (DUF2267 family)
MIPTASLDKSSQKTNIWIRDALIQLDWTDSQRAYAALRGVLHALRDRLPVAEIVQLGAQLPTFVRGVYYEGWNPAHTPLKNRKKEAFLSQILTAFQRRADIDAEHVARAIIRVLLYHVSKGEMEQIKNSLPHDIRQYWPNHDIVLRNAS